MCHFLYCFLLIFIFSVSYLSSMSDVLSGVEDSKGQTGEEISGAQKPGHWTQTEPRAILRGVREEIWCIFLIVNCLLMLFVGSFVCFFISVYCIVLMVGCRVFCSVFRYSISNSVGLPAETLGLPAAADCCFRCSRSSVICHPFCRL